MRTLAAFALATMTPRSRAWGQSAFDMTAIGVVATSLNTLVNITKAMKDVQDATLIKGKVFELRRAIIDAQQSVFAANEERTALIERVRDLEAKIANFETWQTEKHRYELKAMSPGIVCYALKLEAQRSEPMHYICQTCYEQGKRHILQLKPPNAVQKRIGGSPNKYVCPACKSGNRRPLD